MKTDRETWSRLFRLVKKTWRELRPRERIHSSRIIKMDFGVTFFRDLTDNIRTFTSVSAWKVGTSEWSTRGRILVLDHRVAKLRSEIEARSDYSLVATLDFDILAAAAAMEGCELERSPRVDLGASDDEVRLVVKELSDKVDRIWTFAGGFTVEGLETLSIWVLRNRYLVGASMPDVGPICAALIYGERRLAGELLWVFELDIRKRRLLEYRNEVAHAIHADYMRQITTIRGMLA